ncbi:hypothetical protein BRAS3843_700001 [Bradyrhizobium sp. STM 3843]|nr:hypothetical protein BRAS3843_700001 [Bradyrhizobium sp. STM 3843]
MWKPLSPVLEFLDRYHGWIVGFAALAAVLLLNQLIYRRRWKSYPTLEQYLATHPGCHEAEGVVCSRCRRKALGARVINAGRIYRCAWCETELYRIDKTG